MPRRGTVPKRDVLPDPLYIQRRRRHCIIKGGLAHVTILQPGNPVQIRSAVSDELHDRHPDIWRNLPQIGVQLIQGLSLRVSSGKPGYIHDKQTRVCISLYDRCMELHLIITPAQ